ncbi:MAG: hypothetical protein AABW73_03845 [Nanoarchaeota archaeon]
MAIPMHRVLDFYRANYLLISGDERVPKYLEFVAGSDIDASKNKCPLGSKRLEIENPGSDVCLIELINITEGRVVLMSDLEEEATKYSSERNHTSPRLSTG